MRWLPDGMVDVADSKSAARKGVRVRVSGEPPLSYQIKIFNKDGSLDQVAKSFISRYINLKKKGPEGIGLRIKSDQLIESDLFFLNGFLPKIFLMKTKKFNFTLL
jgi:hypothetical protein